MPHLNRRKKHLLDARVKWTSLGKGWKAELDETSQKNRNDHFVANHTFDGIDEFSSLKNVFIEQEFSAAREALRGFVFEARNIFTGLSSEITMIVTSSLLDAGFDGGLSMHNLCTRLAEQISSTTTNRCADFFEKHLRNRLESMESKVRALLRPTWNATAAIDYLCRRINTPRKLTRKDIQELEQKYGHTIRRIRQLPDEMLRNPLRHASMENKCCLANSAEVKKWVLRTIKDHPATSLSSLGRMLKTGWGRGSKATAHRLLTKYKCRLAKCKILPVLNDEHKRQRLLWSTTQLAQLPMRNPSQVLVHIDEKWFYHTNLSRKYWTAPGEKAPYFRVENKKHVNKVMFLGAVACPNQPSLESGAIGLYPIVKTCTAQRKRALGFTPKRLKGEQYLKNVTLDKQLFVEMLQKTVIPDILKKSDGCTTKITIQMDSGGGHGGGRKKLREVLFPDLDQWVRDHLPSLWPHNTPIPEICFVAQPPRSPDLNVLDLGVWNHIQSAVHVIDPYITNWVEEINQAVQCAWGQMSKDLVLKMFDNLRMYCKCIIDSNGDNNFASPHHRDAKAAILPHMTW